MAASDYKVSVKHICCVRNGGCSLLHYWPAVVGARPGAVPHRRRAAGFGRRASTKRGGKFKLQAPCSHRRFRELRGVQLLESVLPASMGVAARLPPRARAGRPDDARPASQERPERKGQGRSVKDKAGATSLSAIVLAP